MEQRCTISTSLDTCLIFFEERGTHRETSKVRYGEWHHILPKSLGGSDNDENMIWLECGEFFFHMK